MKWPQCESLKINENQYQNENTWRNGVSVAEMKMAAIENKI
jgi:hypothetical protein